MNGFRLSGSCTMPMCSVTFSAGAGLDEAAARATPTAAASSEQQDEDQRRLDEQACRPSTSGHADPPVRIDRRRQAPVPCGRR